MNFRVLAPLTLPVFSAHNNVHSLPKSLPSSLPLALPCLKRISSRRTREHWNFHSRKILSPIKMYILSLPHIHFLFPLFKVRCVKLIKLYPFYLWETNFHFFNLKIYGVMFLAVPYFTSLHFSTLFLRHSFKPILILFFPV
jgi:hypothetical protein